MKFYCFIRGLPSAEIIREFTFFKERYTINGPEWEVLGNFYAHNYQIVKKGNEDEEVAIISKAFLSWGDSYKIDIFDEENELNVLLVCLAIDCVKESQEAAASSASSSN